MTADDVGTPEPFRALDNWTHDALRKATAEREDAIRHKLIELGWTPPGEADSASDTELLEVAENALGQAGMMFDRIQKAAPAAIEKVDHLGPTLAVLRQAHDEIHNEVEHRKRSRDADGTDAR